MIDFTFPSISAMKITPLGFQFRGCIALTGHATRYLISSYRSLGANETACPLWVHSTRDQFPAMQAAFAASNMFPRISELGACLRLTLWFYCPLSPHALLGAMHACCSAPQLHLSLSSPLLLALFSHTQNLVLAVEVVCCWGTVVYGVGWLHLSEFIGFLFS